MLGPFRIWNWCRRFRHRCGYGVHSPSDFYLITSVIYEKSPYYAYQMLDRKSFSKSLPHYRNKINRLLFRLVNYLQPASLMEVGKGNGSSLDYMCAACSKIPSEIFENESCDNLLMHFNNRMVKEDRNRFLHIGHTPYYKEVFEASLSFRQNFTCIVVGFPYQNQEKKKWWKEVIQDDRVKITFDLYDIGIVFFNEGRYKQNYIVNFL